MGEGREWEGRGGCVFYQAGNPSRRNAGERETEIVDRRLEGGQEGRENLT